ncbi:BrxE family protein [Gammaproteobacteria bacterium]|nr:BrxE family protein [Gammaproteobacteria bacterium]
MDDSKASSYTIILARTIVGYLGEKSQHNWWPSEFFSAASAQFISPVFAKTSSLARYSGICEVGRRAHDESIGVGQRVVHLFRLPASLEQQLHESAGSQLLDEEIAGITSSVESATAKLSELADGSSRSAEGPIVISDSVDFASNEGLAATAQCYLTAFKNNKQCFPYAKASE